MVIKLSGQEVQFTQFQSAPMFLNPAFAGSTEQHRYTAAYRNQWPGVKRAFTTYIASYEYNADQYNSGLGAYVIQDLAGSTNMVGSLLGLNYSYRIKTGFSSDVRGGLMLGLGQKRVNSNKLVFNDQFITGSSVSEDAANVNSKNYIDIGLGGVFNSTDFRGGIAVKHINKPVVSMNGGTEGLPIYLSLHGVYKIMQEGEDTSKTRKGFNILMQYRHELNNDQFDVGVSYMYHALNFGLYYRGLPLKHSKETYFGNDCLALVFGLDLQSQHMKILYSADFTISGLGMGNTFGAHELTLVYEPFKVKKKIIKVNKNRKKKTSIKRKF